MGEQMVPLRKASGGCTVLGYHWAHDGDVTEVPYDVAMELLAIPGGGYSVADDEPEPVTEPAPAAKAPVTEPAPAAKAPARGSGTPAKGPAARK
jgi:hypothetical protein